jgi:hypothetical protein
MTEQLQAKTLAESTTQGAEKRHSALLLPSKAKQENSKLPIIRGNFKTAYFYCNSQGLIGGLCKLKKAMVNPTNTVQCS